MDYYLDGFAVSYLTVFAVYLTFGVAFGLLTLLYSRLRFGSVQWDAFLLVASLATVGGLCGYLGGASRVGTVGDIVPAFIGLLAGLAAFLFGSNSTHREIVTLSVLGFSAVLFFGFAYGAKVREDAEFNRSFVAACQGLIFDPASYEDANQLAQRLNDRDDELVRMCELFFKAR